MSDDGGRETIEVEPSVFGRFERERAATQDAFLPAFDQSTFLDSLLDTRDAVRDTDTDGSGSAGVPGGPGEDACADDDADGFEVVICVEGGYGREHADALRHRLLQDGFYEDVVSVREAASTADVEGSE